MALNNLMKFDIDKTKKPRKNYVLRGFDDCCDGNV